MVFDHEMKRYDTAIEVDLSREKQKWIVSALDPEYFRLDKHEGKVGEGG